MSGNTTNVEPPIHSAFELPAVGYEDVKENFPETDVVPETKGVLNFTIDFQRFKTEILQEHTADKFERAYDTRSARIRGRCLIINNRTFIKKSERLGTDTDCTNLEKLFSQLLFKVEIKNDQTAEQMKTVCKNFILDPEHEQYTCCILAILSHGKQGKFFGSDDQEVNEIDLLRLFNDPACKLKNKPKLVIIQACRTQLATESKNTQTENSDEVNDGPTCENGEEFNLIEHLRKLNCKDARDLDEKVTPSFADILIAHSTLPGYLSWRNTECGSWFVQAITEVFSRHFHQEHVADLMVEVNRIVSEAFGQHSENGEWQMPCPTNHLRKKFYFFPSQ